MTATQPARVPGVRRPVTPHDVLVAVGDHRQARRDAATLRAAAAIVEAREATAPHLAALRNRLLTLATQIAPPRTHDQEDTHV